MSAVLHLQKAPPVLGQPSSTVLRFERRAVLTDGPHGVGADVLRHAPDGAIVFNAPRPLCGDLTWTGEFVTGRFYSAVLHEGAERSPHAPRRAWMLHENRTLAAVVLRPISEAQAQMEVRAFYEHHPKLHVYLQAYMDRGLWDKHWFGAWYEHCAWDAVEVHL